VSGKGLFVILNPKAGRGQAGQQRAELEARLHGAGLEFTLATTQGRGGAIALAQRAAEQGYATVAAVGGDGTLSEAANGLLLAARLGAPRARLAPIPFGTGNDFVKMFEGVEANDLAGAATRIARGQVRTIDAGIVNGRYFINVVGMGLDAQVTIESLKIPVLTGFSVYLAGTVRALALYNPGPMTVQYDGQQLTSRALFLNVGNGRSHGGTFRLTPDALMDDGKLDICFVEQMPLPLILRHFPKVLNGSHTRLPWVTMGRAARITVSCPTGAPLAADGEVLSTDARQVEIVTLPQALDVVC
jgi:diacylglycerol kinase (ATP)